MRIYPDCVPCLAKFTLDAAQRATQDADLLVNISLKGLRIILDHGPEAMPPQIAQAINRMITRLTKVDDPYREEKRQHNRSAMSLYPSLRKEIHESSDPLRTALRAAAGGNRIDSVFSQGLEPQRVIEHSLTSDFVIDHYDVLRQTLGRSSTLLVLGDNAGEIAFDKLMIEEIKRVYPELTVTYVVKGGPVINDATMDDARAVDMGAVAEVVDNGDNAPGTILSQCSSEMQQLFHRADTLIVKGQGNFETLEEERKEGVFFLLQVKCPVVARNVDAPIDSLILYQPTS